MVKTLDTLEIGESGVVKSVTGEPKIRRRLFDMGVTPGAAVYLRKRAPLGDPIEITIRGYELTLRKVEAKNCDILVNDKEPADSIGAPEEA